MHTPRPTATGARGDFDFLVGHWTTRQRRLTRRLQDSDDWETFTATAQVQQLPGGVINFDTLVAEDWRPGWVGMSLRVFNPATQLWSIQWVTNEGGGIDAASGQLASAVVGRFEGDDAWFEGPDELDGRPIRVRFHWQRLGPNSARWQQAFSDDGGRHWEVNWIMDFQRDADPAAGPLPRATVPVAERDTQVVELRQYRLHPGRREALVSLFEREFIETQEAAGMSVMGQFRDLDAPDRFVWLRGFADMAARTRALQAFYDGPTWQRHRDAANATMVDSDDVLLLRPAWPGAGLAMAGRRRAAGSVRMAPAGLLLALLLPLQGPPDAALLQFCRDELLPCLQRGGGRVLGWYATETAPNGFARLPVREGEQVLLALVMFDDVAAHAAFEQDGRWTHEVAPRLAPWLRGPVERRRLVATARSALHG